MAIYTRPEREVRGAPPGYTHVGSVVQTATGNFVHTETDLSLSDSLLTFRRTYNSRASAADALGPGWTHSHGAHLVRDDAVVRLHAPDGRVLTFRRESDGSYTRAQDLDAALTSDDDGFVLRFFSGERWRFDKAGRLVETADDGCSVTFEYADGRLARLAHSTGRQLALGYDDEGHLTEVTSDDGRSVHYAHRDGALREVTFPGGAVQRYDVDEEGRVVAVTDADETVLVHNAYDADGRVRRHELAGAGALDLAYDEERGHTTVTHAPSGAVSRYVHDADFRTLQATDALGHTSTLAYDSDGRLVRAELPDGGVVERRWENGDLVAVSEAGTTVRHTYDDRHRLLSTTGPLGEVTRYTYDSDGHVPATVTAPDGAVTRFHTVDGLIVARTGPDGGTARYGYDAHRNLVSVLAPDGQRTAHRYDDAGRRTATVHPTGETTEVRYDDAARPVARTGLDGYTATTEYSAAGRPLRHTDAEGAETSFAYDAAGRLTSRTDPEGRTTAFEYDEEGRPQARVLPDGVRVEARFDAVGRLAGVVEPDAGETTFEYDAAGNQTAIHAPEGTTSMTYDERGNQLTLTVPGGATTHVEYDAADRPVRRVDAAGESWRTEYDTAAGTVTHTAPDGARRTTVRGADGHVRESIDALGRRTVYRYDRKGRLTTVVDPEGGRTHFARDGLGRVVARTSPAGLTTRYAFHRGRLVSVTDPRGWITRYHYDRNGRRTRTVTPSGATTTFGYNKSGALTEVVDPRGGVTSYTYDAGGNLVRSTDAKGAVTSHGYDRAGRRTSTTDPLGRTSRRGYDDAGRLATLHSAAGDVVHLSYNEAGRLVRRHTDAGEEVTYAYDAAGRRNAMTDTTGTTRYTYDAVGRLTSATWPGDRTYTWRYDDAGQLRELTYPGGESVAYRYDLNGRLVWLRDSQAGEAAYAVDPDGRLRTEQLPGGWARRYGYDGGLLTSFAEHRGGVVATEVTLERDAEKRVARHQQAGSVREFSYDPAGQLTGVRATGPAGTRHRHFGYDLVGNRTTEVTDDVATRQLHDAADQLVAVETAGRRIEYRYDDAGRLTGAEDGDVAHHVTYDGFGQPVRAVTSRSWAVEETELAYNGDGFLARWRGRTGDEAAPSTEVRYEWGVGERLPQVLHQHVSTEVPAAGEAVPTGGALATARFTYGHSRTFAATARGTANFARDAYGSAVATRATAPWVQAGEYDEFGVAPGTETLPEPHPSAHLPQFGYRGELALGPMLNLRARHYDSTLGRFTTRDPISVLGAGTLANHPYAYAHNDPLNRADPQGTWPSPVLSGAGLVGSALQLASNGCAECRDPGNGIESHKKCFQGKTCLHTRGSFTQEQLDAESDALVDLWHSGRKEAMGHALALAELNGRRQGFWRDVGEGLGFGRAVSEDVDWEVGTRSKRDPAPYFRMDIVTDEENIFEVKQWKNGSPYWEVEQQLDRYLLNGSVRNLVLYKGKELQDWADSVDVITGLRWPWSEEIVYVWGLGNSEGHIYVGKDDGRLKDEMKGKADERRAEREVQEQFNEPLIPLPIRIPVPVVP